MASPDNTGKKQVSGKEATQFKPGQSGNPAGRPKGARNKLNNAFLEDAVTVWGEGGIAALREMMRDKPNEFSRMIAGLVPAKMEHTGEDGGPLQHQAIERKIVDPTHRDAGNTDS